MMNVEHRNTAPPTRGDIWFRRLGMACIICVYLVILAGGIVRATGSGMGCPDWPKCFGKVVPPTDVSQLPANYQEIYNVHGHGVEQFNAAKTWTEYINRLLGALLGVVAFFTFVAANFVRRGARLQAVAGSFAALALIGFNGWLGAKVVSSNLAGYMVTIHMMLALLTVFVIIYAIGWRRIPDVSAETRRKPLLIGLAGLALLFALAQIALGAQTREAIDEVARQMNYQNRASWPEAAGLPYFIHRSFSILLLAANVVFVQMVYTHTRQSGLLYLSACFVYFVLGLEILLGIGLAYAGLPAWMQPLHLFLGAALAGLNFLMLLALAKQWMLARRPLKIAVTA